MKVLVTGSRHWTDAVLINQTLTAVSPTCIVHGGAQGADRLAGEWARSRGIEERVYKAKWDLYGRAAGTNRNLQMLREENLLDEPIEVVLAFPLPDSIGTYHMIRIAAEAGIPIENLGHRG